MSNYEMCTIAERRKVLLEKELEIKKLKPV